MSLYRDSDVTLMEDRIEQITKTADQMRLNNVQPTKEKMWEMIYIVRDFVIEKKRKIYGGFALNKLIEEISPKDKFYDDANIEDWDIDFYSPDPISDAKEIADRLHAKGFKYVRATEAQHDETYKIFAETLDCADISYVPRNIYHKIPFRIYKGLYLTGPQFMMIDYFRMMSDPMTSYFRIEKSFKRLTLMQKYYPLPHSDNRIEIEPPTRDLDIAMNLVHNFLIDRKSCIVVGMYALNHLINESKIWKRKNSNPIQYNDINYYEIISTEYKKDTKDLIKQLLEKFKYMKSDRISYREYYPFFQYLGYSVGIFFDNEMICRVYHYNGRCTPYFERPALYFKKEGFDQHNGLIRIGSFATLLMYCLIIITKAKTDDDQMTKNLYYTMVSQMIEMKNYYFDQTKKTIFDESLFQEFVMRCTGEVITPQMEKQMRIEKKKQLKKNYSYHYDPAADHTNETNNRYQFKNSSGNEIRNEKNLKINLNDVDTSEIDEAEDLIDIDDQDNQIDQTANISE